MVVGDRKMAVFDDVADGRQAACSIRTRSTGRIISRCRRAPRAEPVPVETRSSRCGPSASTSSSASGPAQRRGPTAPRASACSPSCSSARRLLEAGGRPAGPAERAGDPRTAQRYFAHESAFIDEGVEIGRRHHDLARLTRPQELAGREGLPDRPERGHRARTSPSATA